jgi:hypothetical protein
MSATSLVAPLVFGDLTSDIFKVHVLGNNVRISGPLLAKEIPNLVYENYTAKGEKHAGTKKSGSRIWTLECRYHNSLPFHVEVSPKASLKMCEGKCPGQRAAFVANNRDAQAAERVAQDDQATATAIQKNTEVVAEVLVKVNSTKTDLQELNKTQAVLLEKVTELTQLQAHSESMSQESALTRQLGSPTEPVTGANDPTRDHRSQRTTCQRRTEVAPVSTKSELQSHLPMAEAAMEATRNTKAIRHRAPLAKAP